VTIFGGHDLASSVHRIAPLDEGEDHLRAGILPARIADRDQVRITADAQSVQHLPGLVEQRMMRVRRRKGYLLGLLARPPPAPLSEQQLRVREAPALSALALALGVCCAPGAEIFRVTKPQATVCLAHLLPTTLGVSGPVAGLALSGAAATGVGIVTSARPGLMDSQADSVGELTSAAGTALSRHDLRQ
jgi:hypothetical protein